MMKLILAAAISFGIAASAQTVVDGSLTSACSGATATFDTGYTQNACTVTQAITTVTIPNGTGGGRPFVLKMINPSGYSISGWPSTVSVPPMAPGTTYLRGIWDPTANGGTGMWVFQPVGNQSFYGASGLLSGGKCWLGTTTSNTSGVATVNYSTAGFTAAPLVFIQPYAQSAAASGQYWANPQQSTITTTGATIIVTTPATVVVANLSIQLGSVAIPLAVMACGN